ncbi:MAG: hypothetical protein LCH37_14865 [Bacteroidetes bacterium]|nr:hypothetical protein [Bacteroidota bacterium]
MADLYLIETNSSIEFIKTVLNSDTGVATQVVYFVIDTVSRLLIVISLGKKG